MVAPAALDDDGEESRMATVAESAMNGLDPMFQPEWFFNDEQLALLARLKEI